MNMTKSLAEIDIYQTTIVLLIYICLQGCAICKPHISATIHFI